MSYKGGYQGAVYAPVRKRRCTVHDVPVEPCGLCALCHCKSMHEAGHAGYVERAREYRRELERAA